MYRFVYVHIISYLHFFDKLYLGQYRTKLSGVLCSVLPQVWSTSAYPYVRRQCRYCLQLCLSASFQTSQQRKEKLLGYICWHFDLNPVFTDDHLLWDSGFSFLRFSTACNTLCLHRSSRAGDALRNTQRYDLLQRRSSSFQQFFSHHIQA